MRHGSLFVATLLFALASGCMSSTKTVKPSSTCPSPGTNVPVAKVLNTAYAKDFVGCDIEAEAEFVQASWGTYTCPNVNVKGQVQFMISSPGGQDKYLALVPTAAGDPVFSASAGSKLLLHGGAEFSEVRSVYGAAAGMAGQGCTVFRATSIEAF